MRLFLIRHGETKLNKEFRFIGKTDVGLSNDGLAQAKFAAEQLKRENIKSVYSSDSKRALKTAELIAKKHGLKVKSSSSLREIDFGEWEGLNYEEISKNHNEIFGAWLDDPAHIEIPGGEPWKEFQSRVICSIGEIIENERIGDIAVVTHGGPIKVIMSRYNGESLELFKNFWPAPGSITVVDILDSEISSVGF